MFPIKRILAEVFVFVRRYWKDMFGFDKNPCEIDGRVLYLYN